MARMLNLRNVLELVNDGPPVPAITVPDVFQSVRLETAAIGYSLIILQKQDTITFVFGVSTEEGIIVGI